MNILLLGAAVEYPKIFFLSTLGSQDKVF